jgi:hypothetical protein
MGSMLLVDVVVGTDIEKVRQALWLLTEAGLNKSSLDSIKYEFQTDECVGCHQHWQRKASLVVALPEWRHPFSRGDPRPNGWPPSNLLGRVNSYIQGYDEEHPVSLAWRDAHACPACLMTVTDQVAENLCRMPRKLFNGFCRAFSLTIPLQHAEYGDGWNQTRQYAGYVAVTNALLQHLKLEGNRRALALLVEASHHLGML